MRSQPNRWTTRGILVGWICVAAFLLPVSSGTAPAVASAPSASTLHPWVNLTATAGTAPAARAAYGMAYDPDLGAVVLFGGITSAGTALGDTWEFVHGHWKNMALTAPSAPSARWQFGMIYYPPLHGVVLWGGQSNYYSVGSGCCHNDTWLYNKTGWHNLSTPVAPEVQAGSGFVYDSTDGYAVLFGGPAVNPGYHEVWIFKNASWVNVTGKVTGAPPALGWGLFADDPNDGYVLLFGGDSGCSGAGITWSFRHLVFHNLTAKQTSSPAAKMGSRASAYDPVVRGVVMTGGYDASCSVVNQTWLFHAGHWRNVSSVTGTLIPGRWDARMVWDAKLGRSGADLTFSGNEALVGGSNSFGADTWKLAP